MTSESNMTERREQERYPLPRLTIGGERFAAVIFDSPPMAPTCD